MRPTRSRLRSTARYGAPALGAILALAALLSTALGYWSGAGDHGEGDASAIAASVMEGAAPTVSESSSTNVLVSWGSSGQSNGDRADGYTIRRYALRTGVEASIGAGCAGTRTTTTCTESSTPAGDWQYTVTPVVGTNWRGAESDKSGSVDTGPGSMTLARSVFGGPAAPLPATINGTVSGFSANEAVVYTIDDVVVTGSPTHVGSAGTATIALTLPAGTSDGPHTIAVLGAGAEASGGIIVDTEAPTIAPFITPAPNLAGWNNTSPVEINGTADDGDGSGLAFAKYTTDGSNPKTSSTALYATAPLSIAATTTLTFYLADVAGNESDVETLDVKIDTSVPYFGVQLVNVAGGVYQAPPAVPGGPPSTAYYRGAAAGSLTFKVTPVPMGGSLAVSAGFSALPADAFGFSFDSSAVTTLTGGSFFSNPMSWAAGTTSTPGGTISMTNAAGSTFSAPGLLHNDSAPPAGGYVDATGLSGTGGRYSNSSTISLDFAKGTDAASGLATGAGPSDIPAKLLRASAGLSSNGTANGSCGTYGSFTQVGAVDPASPVIDVVPDDHTCYRYEYLVSDHVGNVATYTSPDIKVLTTPSLLLTPTDATLTAVSGISSQFVAGSTVYYNPAQSGRFNVDTSSSAVYAGVARVDFPTLAGFSGGGTVTTPLSATTFRNSYAWSANAASPSPGVQSISATNHNGQTSTNAAAFSVVQDATGPSGGSVDAIGLGGTGGRYSTSTTLSIGFAGGADAGSGLATVGAELSRASASLTSNGTASGSCGTFGAYTQIGADDPVTPQSDTIPVDRICYRYHYDVADRVGNQTTYTSPDVKVDATPPPAPALGFSALSNAYWSGSGTAIYYRPGAGSGGFRVTAASVDTTAGTNVIGFPALPAGWSSSSGGFGIRDYGWSAANPTAPSGAQDVTATNHAGRSSSASFTATPDGAAPAGGGVTYATGYTTAATVSVGFTTGTDSGSGLDVSSALLQRSAAPLSGGSCGTFGAFTTIAAAPATPHANGVTTGNCYQYRYLISDNVGNQATYSSAGVAKVDSGAPVVSIANPGAAVQSSVTVSVNASDAAGAGVSSVKLQRAPTGTSSWTDVCTDTSAPYGCDLTTTPAGIYDLRAIATDGAGNSATSAIVTIQVDNTAPTITMTDPGSPISGTITLATTAADAGSGVAGVTIQRAPTGTGTWTNTCVIGASPWTCSFNSTAVSDGAYDFRAIAVDAAGNSGTSATVAGRTILNAVRGVDVQAANKTGGALGEMEQGDILTLTYSTAMKASTLITGWTGTGAASLSVVLTDVGGVETMTLNSSGIIASGLGIVTPNGNYVFNNQALTFAASTATLSSAAGGGSIVTIVLGARTGNGARTQTTAVTMGWTPSATATNLAGVPSATTPVTESGSSDFDF